MSLTDAEKAQWEDRIVKSQDPNLIRSFFARTNEPDKVREAFRKAVTDLADYDILLQGKYEDKVFSPELPDDEIKEIAAGRLLQDVDDGDVGGVFEKLDYSVFQTEIPQDKLTTLVNKAVSEGRQGYEPGKSPREFVLGLIEFPFQHESPEEASFAYAIFNDDRYREMVSPQLATNAVTLKICHEIILGRFDIARQIRDKYSEHYNEELARYCVVNLPRKSTDYAEDYPWEYLIYAARSEFRGVFESLSDDRMTTAMQIARFIGGEDVPVTPAMDEAVASISSHSIKQKYAEQKVEPYEKTPDQLPIAKLDAAFDEAEDMFGILVGIRSLGELLSNDDYVQAVGAETIREKLQARVDAALQAGKADVVYSLLYGTNVVGSTASRKFDGVAQLSEYVEVNKADLLDRMITAIDWSADELLSDSHSFSCDNLTGMDGTSDFDNAYDLYVAIRDDAALAKQMPSAEQLQKIVLLKMAAHAKEHSEGRGMVVMTGVYEDPKNADYIDTAQVRKLLQKVLQEFFVETLIGSFEHPERTPYFYRLVDSRLGELVDDNPNLAPFFALREFMQNGAANS